MAEMPYPYYRLQADGSSESGFLMQFQLDQGAGGPLEGMTIQGILDHLKDYFTNTSTAQITPTVTLAYSAVTTTNNL